MGDLAKFFADIIEFIVGGVLFMASLLLLISSVSPQSLAAAADDLAKAPMGLSSGYTIAALSVVYAMGIVAEGLSRLIFEWRLGRLTESEFPDGSSTSVAQREEQRLTVMDRSERLTEAINVQLKRLRIERTLALSSAVATIAFVIMRELWWSAGLLALTLLAIYLVDERFRRYLKTIKASYAAAQRSKPAGATE